MRWLRDVTSFWGLPELLLWAKKGLGMKVQQHTTEDKIRILLQADRGDQTIPEIRRDENTELKKMLTESLLKNRVLEAVCKEALNQTRRRAVALEVATTGLCNQRAVSRILLVARSAYSFRGGLPTSAEQQFRQRVHELRELARERGGRCVSETYPGNQGIMIWRCAKGHLWEATPATIKADRRCPVCAGQGV